MVEEKQPRNSLLRKCHAERKTKIQNFEKKHDFRGEVLGQSDTQKLEDNCESWQLRKKISFSGF